MLGARADRARGGCARCEAKVCARPRGGRGDVTLPFRGLPSPLARSLSAICEGRRRCSLRCKSTPSSYRMSPPPHMRKRARYYWRPRKRRGREDIERGKARNEEEEEGEGAVEGCLCTRARTSGKYKGAPRMLSSSRTTGAEAKSLQRLAGKGTELARCLLAYFAIPSSCSPYFLITQGREGRRRRRYGEGEGSQPAGLSRGCSRCRQAEEA